MKSTALRRSAAEAFRTRSLKAFPCAHQRVTGVITPAVSSPLIKTHLSIGSLPREAIARLQSIRQYSSMAPPRLETVSVAIDDGVATLKYNRPNNANALSPQMMKDLGEAFRYINAEPSVRVIVYTGEGKFFTAGLDLQAVPKDGPVISDEGVEYLRQIHMEFINSPKVIIAAVNGPAVGYGSSTMGLCDLVYSVPDAVFFTPFVKLGVCAEACSSVTFMRIMGRQKASAMILAGERMTASELESAGMITKILAKDGFMDEVMKIARRVAAQPAGSLEFNKRLLMEPIRGELLAANERECQGLRDRCRTNEPIEAVRAFERDEKARKNSQKSSKL